jgi:hypothetical protein
MSVKELAKGTVYTQALETGWKPPAHIRALTEDECEEVRVALCACSRSRKARPALQTHAQQTR